MNYRTRKGAIANALQLEVDRRRASRSGLFLANFVLPIRANRYFAASDQNSDIAIRFSDLDFLKWSINLAIRRRLHAVTLTFNTWPWTFLLHTASCDKLPIKFDRNRTISSCVIYDLVRCHRPIFGGAISSWASSQGCVDRTVPNLVETEDLQRPSASLFCVSDMLLPFESRPIKDNVAPLPPVKIREGMD